MKQTKDRPKNSEESFRNDLLVSHRQGKLKKYLDNLNLEQLQYLSCCWELWARDDQLPPQTGARGNAWLTWLILGGRGAGKTRTGAEWIRSLAQAPKAAHEGYSRRIALVAETFGDAREVMVQGISGLLNIHAPEERPVYEATRRRLVWPSGAIAQLFSADDPESLRGPQFNAAWCDELCKWRYGEAAWDMLQFGLRLGKSPRQVVTTTPRPMPLLKRIMNADTTVTVKASTHANAANLAPGFLKTVIGRYEGTRLGRQEIDAEILEDNPNALWQRDVIEQFRVRHAPQLRRIIVAVDPPASSTRRSDACGIICAGLDDLGHGFVLKDETCHAVRPLEWARIALRIYHQFEADALVAEVNQGGDMVKTIIAQVDDSVPVKAVRATRGKWLRAEPVAALYAQGKVHHVGALVQLEDQMCDLTSDGKSGGRSPDRVDALVWALTELMLHHQAGPPRIRDF